MIFIGSGAIPWRAIAYALRTGLHVDLICCPKGDVLAKRGKRYGIPILESDNPNHDLPRALSQAHENVILSINNKYILDDNVLSSGVPAFNIHCGLTQHYRGIAEICIFAAICHAERYYGVTLHRLLPGQKVDGGAVVDQVGFDMGDDETFCSVFARCVEACQEIYERNAATLAAASCPIHTTKIAKTSYTYKSVPEICAAADVERLRRASSLGPYGGYFSRLKLLVDASGARQS